MECVNCTACIDACNTVMERINRPKGLIRYASRNGLETGERLKITPRIAAYTAILFALIGTFLFLIFTRSPVETSLLRAPGALYQTMPDGRYSNLYTLKLANKTNQRKQIDLKLQNLPGEISVLGTTLTVAPESLAKTSVLVKLAPETLSGGQTEIVVGVYDGEEEIQTLKNTFSIMCHC